jgi:Asp-tRNA(Asn)/Glu-tRNA(Gln) amidotransferase A subunit family amidase
MAGHDIPWLSAAETAVAIKTKQVSPVEVVQAYLARIERFDGQLHAYITVMRDEALAAARQAEQMVLRGGDLGPLFGVPVAVKDQFWTRGILTTNGSRAYRDFVPDADATVITRLQQAGTILLGKLNLSELAMGGTQEPHGASRGTRGISNAHRGSQVQVLAWRSPRTSAPLRWERTPGAPGAARHPTAVLWACVRPSRG